MRRSRGYALVSTMVIGFSAILALMAIGAYVTTDLQSESRAKQNATLRTAAEAGLDYVIHKFNTEYPCSLDPENGDSLESELPSDYLTASYGSIASVASKVTVKVTVKRLSTESWSVLQTFTSIYDPQLDLGERTWVQSASGTPPSTNLSFSTDQWRIVESRATSAERTRTYRAILKPVLLASQILSTAPSPSSSPYFKFGLFGNSKLVIGSEDPAISVPITVRTSESANTILQESGVGAQYKLKLASNQSALVGNGAEIQGDLQVRSLYLDPSQSVVQNYGTIDGRVLVNNSVGASVEGFSPSSPYASGDNVLADADSPGSNPLTINRLGENVSSVAQGSDFGADPYLMNPAASASLSAEPLAPLSQIASSETPEIQGGDWVTSGLSTADMDGSTSPVQIKNSSTPVRVFIKDSPQSSDAVNIDASKITSDGTAPNLQIFYSGTKPIKISLSGQTFKGVVYAPLSSVSTSGNGTFDGAIVGDSVHIGHSGSMIIHTELSDTNSLGPSGLYRDPDSETGYLDRWQWQPVTWQEVQ